jgi:hypothetical protein
LRRVRDRLGGGCRWEVVDGSVGSGDGRGVRVGMRMSLQTVDCSGKLGVRRGKLSVDSSCEYPNSGKLLNRKNT